MNRGALWLARAGAVAYVGWALLHFQAAWSVFQLGSDLPSSAIQGRVLQNGWMLACSACTALCVALALNWRNSALGFWLNLAVLSAVDVGFILFVLAPGHAPPWPGLLGPLLWVVGALLSGLALRGARPRPGQSR